jgi:hypothetical protein
MSDELQRQGFVKVRPASFGDTEEVRFNDVEQADRFVDCIRHAIRKKLVGIG